MRNWGWKNWLMFGVIATLFVVAGVLVIVGVVTHTETGLMGACFGSDGTVETYEEWGAEDCPELTWDGYTFPLEVGAQTSNPYPPEEPETAARGAIDLVNSQLGFNAFRLEPGGCMEGTTVCIRIGEAYDENSMDTEGAVMHRRFQWEGHEVMDCDLRTSNTGNIRSLHRVLVHELGHCLGLGHDDFTDSIMNTTTRDDSMDDQMSFTRFTDSDRALLRQLYDR